MAVFVIFTAALKVRQTPLSCCLRKERSVATGLTWSSPRSVTEEECVACYDSSSLSFLQHLLFSFTARSRQNMLYPEETPHLFYPPACFLTWETWLQAEVIQDILRDKPSNPQGFNARSVTSHSDSAGHWYLPFRALSSAVCGGLPRTKRSRDL